jgi:pyruvate carboxylase
VQRRHQKVIELAPATGMSDELREQILGDAVRLLKSENYRNAGTVEFLVEMSGNVSCSRIDKDSRRVGLTAFRLYCRLITSWK